MEKMLKYVKNNTCKRCEEVETYKHLIWECGEAKKIWQLFNRFATSENQQEERVLEYDNVFKVGTKANINMIKVKAIQELIQIEGPINWMIEKIMKISNDIRYIE
jgi:hypothetical protein